MFRTAVPTGSRRWVVAAAAAITMAACAHPKTTHDAGLDGGLDAGDCPGPAPDQHRPAVAFCPTTRPAGATGDGGGAARGGDCTADHDCNDGGENGRCIPLGSPIHLACTYDTCFSDDGCADGGVCGCRDGLRYNTNTCLPANCHTDSDCGECGYCSPSPGGCFPHTGIAGYFCHTPHDECLTDAECDAKLKGTLCIFDPIKDTRWVCSPADCAG